MGMVNNAIRDCIFVQVLTLINSVTLGKDSGKMSVMGAGEKE